MNDWLPPFVEFSDHHGNWSSYLDAIYEIFQRDFIHSQPEFHGRKINQKRHPVEQGKEAGFWHCISKGSVEAERDIDLGRCKRIRWPKPVINAVAEGKVKCWTNTRRRNETRVVIALEDFSYVVILADRRGHLVLWTQYPVEREHSRRKLKREWEESIKS